MMISSGLAESASSCLAVQRPLRAVLNTSAIATPNSDDAAYERSLTYWARQSGDPRARPRPSLIGSTVRISAAVHRSPLASG